MYKILFVLFISFMSVNVFSQTAESIANQAKAMGITSQEDILKELQKRGMTVEDARRMALINGIDYDEYISRYIHRSTDTITTFTETPTELIVEEIELDDVNALALELLSNKNKILDISYPDKEEKINPR